MIKSPLNHHMAHECIAHMAHPQAIFAPDVIVCRGEVHSSLLCNLTR